MHPRAAELITAWNLAPHPEGGSFREIYRSTFTVDPGDGRGVRPALTTIYFLLLAGEISRWHRVHSDEAWHFLEGDGLELYAADPRFDRVTPIPLGPHGNGAEPTRVIPAHSWQGARCNGDYCLVACTVAPGFDYADFEMLRDRPIESEVARARYPHLGGLI